MKKRTWICAGLLGAVCLMMSGCAGTDEKAQTDVSGTSAKENAESKAETTTTSEAKTEGVTGQTSEAQRESVTGQTSEAQTESVTGQTNEAQTEGIAGQTNGEQTEKSQTSEMPQTEAQTETEMAANGWTVAVDAGHQGSWVDMSAQEPMAPGSEQTKAKATTGTSGSFSQVPEYELNLQVALVLQEELKERGYRVVMAREDNDTAISNKERAELATSEGADISVRIHANGSDDASVSGALTMTPSPSNPYLDPQVSEDSYRLSQEILDAFCEATGLGNLGVMATDEMTGINWSTVPVTILEMGFMTNQADDLYLTDESNHAVMAKGIADGIDAYFASAEAAQTGVSAKEVTQTGAAAQEGTQADTAVQEGMQMDAAAQEGTQKDAAAQEGTQTNAAVQEGTQTDTAAQEGTQTDTAAQEGTQTDTAAQEGTHTNAAAQEGTQANAAAQETAQTDGLTQEAASKGTELTALKEILGENYLNALEAGGEKWAVAVEDLNGNGKCMLNADASMQSASVIKAFIMATVYERAVFAEEAGKEWIDMAESYDGELKELLTNMITVSDNEASNELVRRLGQGDFQTGAAVVNEFCQEHGYTATHLGRAFLAENPTDDNYTSAEDCCNLLSAIYRGELINADASSKMQELLLGQTRKNKIPAGLPEGVRSANKTGEMPSGYGLGTIENDIAVVMDEEKPYVLCVLSNDIADNGAAQATITAISSEVYQYMMSL